MKLVSLAESASPLLPPPCPGSRTPDVWPQYLAELLHLALESGPWWCQLTLPCSLCHLGQEELRDGAPLGENVDWATDGNLEDRIRNIE